MNTNHMIFFIEGNIGSGKSTLIERMARDLKQKQKRRYMLTPNHWIYGQELNTKIKMY